MTSDIEQEPATVQPTEVAYGPERVIAKVLAILNDAKQTLDLCGDSNGPAAILAVAPIHQKYLELKSKGVRIRHIIEITDDNIEQSKQMMEFSELRHLEGLKGYFAILDSKLFASNTADKPGKVLPHIITSTVKGLVEQQQYFFDMLWNKAIPAEQRIRQIEEGIEPEITEVVTGWENIFKRTIENLSSAKQRVDSCFDPQVPRIIVESPMYKATSEFVNRGGKVRVITEITAENLPSIKELMKIQEIRHIDNFKINFGVSENSFTAPTSVYSESSNPQIIYSNSKDIIREHQYLFETLWEKALPIQNRIMQLEEGVEPETTELVIGQEAIFEKTLQSYDREQKEICTCSDSSGVKAIVAAKPILEAAAKFVQRGGSMRFITEITPENLSNCKELMKNSEIRHLEGVRSNFGVSSRDYFGYMIVHQKGSISHVVHSTSKKVLNEQRFLFNILWEKAIPAEQRINELERGVRPRTIEIIHDTHASIARAFDIMKSVKNEYSVLFASARTFIIAAKTGIAEIYGDMARRGVRVRILVPNTQDDDTISLSLQYYSKQLIEAGPNIELKISYASIESQISFLVSDKNEVITWELKDDRIDDPYEAGGAAIYSNIEALAISYATIFDNLWKVTDLTDTLRTANMKLEDSHRAMKDFINIAAHELRTPIQPILGLSQILYENNSTGRNNSGYNSNELLQVIERNAKRLDRLAEDILDVARIESGTMKLKKENVDLWEIILKIADEINMSASAGNNNVKVLCSRETPENEPVIASVDPVRISQVISNLLGNAMKFTRGGSISIKLRRNENRIDGNQLAHVIISDMGSGIDPEILPKLFEKFVTKSEKGTGLGLFISKGIIEAHGGKIWAENNNGTETRGATFSFTLPL